MLLAGLGCVVFNFVSPQTLPASTGKPNVLMIVSDDQGYHDLGCFGSKEILTPNLDRLASGGVRLTSFYVTWPACTPSRGSLLTGRYPQRNGIYDMIRNEAPDYGYKYQPKEYEVSFERIGGMDTREILIPRYLRQAGYASGIYGKWDLGIHKRFLPLARGFDEFYGFVNTGIDYYTHERYGVASMYRNNEQTTEEKGTYCTTLFADQAIQFLARHHESPFFLYVPFNAPHGASSLDLKIRSGGAQAPKKYKAMYPQWKEDYVKRARAGKYGGENALVATRECRRLRYAASITCMDEQIGRILNLLDEYHITEKTLVIFFSDNGGGGGSDNSPLRGHKGMMFEGGNRVPCIVRYPEKIPAGTTSDEFLTTLEILPMLLEQANLSAPKETVLDGFNMLPVLQGKKKSQRTEMFWERRADRACRVGHYKWVESTQGNGLFDLSTDLSEQHDLSKEKPELLQSIKARFAEWKSTMKAAEPRGPFRDY